MIQTIATVGVAYLTADLITGVCYWAYNRYSAVRLFCESSVNAFALFVPGPTFIVSSPTFIVSTLLGAPLLITTTSTFCCFAPRIKKERDTENSLLNRVLGPVEGHCVMSNLLNPALKRLSFWEMLEQIVQKSWGVSPDTL